MNLVAVGVGGTGAMALFGMFFLLVGGWGVGSRLMVEYHKSATTDTPTTSGLCTPVTRTAIASLVCPEIFLVRGWGVGSRLMVEYHKSATTDTPTTSDPCTPMPWNFQVAAHQLTTALRDWAADDLWYSTMRKLPNLSTP